MNKRRFASVWDAIEDTPEQAANMKLRSVLMIALKDHITRTGMSQAQAAQLFGVTQPRVSDLMRGKINLFALEKNAENWAFLPILLHPPFGRNPVRFRGRWWGVLVRWSWSRRQHRSKARAVPFVEFFLRLP